MYVHNTCIVHIFSNTITMCLENKPSNNFVYNRHVFNFTLTKTDLFISFIYT